jgi:hypothetical protein
MTNDTYEELEGILKEIKEINGIKCEFKFILSIGGFKCNLELDGDAYLNDISGKTFIDQLKEVLAEHGFELEISLIYEGHLMAHSKNKKNFILRMIGERKKECRKKNLVFN